MSKLANSEKTRSPKDEALEILGIYVSIWLLELVTMDNLIGSENIANPQSLALILAVVNLFAALGVSGIMKRL